ncbi:MAG TPA: hypothetical protein VHJ38_03125 [Nitrososphaeraceae archaeon]|nr:hypothetical protein [Nitrososphaeraceae archaeon]
MFVCRTTRNDRKSIYKFLLCFITSSRINYKALAEIHPEFREEGYFSQEVPKDLF